MTSRYTREALWSHITKTMLFIFGCAIMFMTNPPSSALAITPTSTASATPSGSIIIHYKGWANPNIYVWIGTNTELRGAWPGTPMTAEANGWYANTIANQSNINLIFNASGQQTANLSRTTGEWWYLNGNWSATNPEATPTNTPTAIVTNTATSTPLPTNTATPLPTNTATPLPTNTATPSGSIVLHYKGWANPNIYAWIGTNTTLRGAWPGSPMTAEANGWYGNTITNQNNINLIFNANGQQTADLNRTTGEWWYTNGAWSATNPDPTATATKTLTPTVVATNTPTATATATKTLTPTMVATNTPTATATATKTLTPTNTPVVATNTPIAPTNTPIVATNTPVIASPTPTATPTTASGSIKLHYKGWTTPNIYAWVGASTALRGVWPGTAMPAEGNGWYVDTFTGQISVSLIVNSGANKTADLSRPVGEWWYYNNQWYSSNPEDLVPPSVTITAPGNGSNLSGVTVVTVNASDNMGIAKVEYYLGAKKIGESSTAPYSLNWNTGTACDGTASLKAKAFDLAGNTTDSALVNVTTTNPNLPPIANAGADINTVVGMAVTFNGLASVDQDCAISSYSWSNGLTGANPTLVYNAAGTYNVTLTVTDNEGATATDNVVVTVNQPTARTDFREETIYFVITSRFNDGDSSNNVYCWDDAKAGNIANNDPCWRGDFKGLIDKLDYIKALGFSAIWITPVVQNSSGYDYHGYHTINFKRVDPRYESNGYNYQRLVNEVHARGMKIIQDIVLNHTGNFGEENLYPMFAKDPTKADTGENLLNIAPAGRLPANYASLTPNAQYAARINAMKEDVNDTQHIYHHEKALSWESYTVETGQIAGDCVDLNTENPLVYNYLIDAYNQYIDMGVDSFRVDTVKHISRVTFNKTFNPAFKARGGQNFFMFGEVAARYRTIWNNGLPPVSVPFYTWKESVNYPWSSTDRLVNETSTLQNWNDNINAATQPSSNNHQLINNAYHTPDWSMRSGLDQIDFPMHWNFNNARDAFGLATSSDQTYNDATWNVTYVDSHDYAPDGAPENQRFAGSQTTWAENLSLIFTFRGIPTIFYGSEIEFKKGMPIDVGPNAPLEQTGRAYYGNNIQGSINVSGFGQYSNATGTMATTLNHPLAQHIRRLNLIRRAVPAFQKGQYTLDGVSGTAMAFKRRYTANGVDSFALVAISGDATFSNLPGGTYTDAITGQSITVPNNGSLTANATGQGNMRVFILNGPGKIGTDGLYLK